MSTPATIDTAFNLWAEKGLVTLKDLYSEKDLIMPILFYTVRDH